jgi:hypothetical protein
MIWPKGGKLFPPGAPFGIEIVIVIEPSIPDAFRKLFIINDLPESWREVRI